MNVNYVDKKELAMAWIDLSYVQNSIFSRQTKPILQSLSGQINFHTLTALMGPSGAGKTTLLKCINMRNNTGLTANTKVFVNKYTPLKTCFIMQSSDEHLFMGLTVRESLLFASKIKNRLTTGVKYRDSYAQTGGSLLCLESCTENGLEISCYSSTHNDCEPIDEKGNFDHNKNINKILSELLLIDCAHNLVNTCSGGEQKRLSVGLELVQQNKPNLLCIDEPTSGLDSNAAELVIQCLSELVVRHRMSIVTSIHQPNSLLLSMFDQLYVLSKGGHCVFTGRPNLLRQHLLSCDITCGEDVLPIELLLKIASKFPNRRHKPLNNNKENDLKIKIDSESDGSAETLSIKGNEIDRLIDNTIISSTHISSNCEINGKIVSNKVTNESKYFNFYHFYYLLLRGFTCIIRYQWRINAALFCFIFIVGLFLIYLYGSDIGKENGCLDVYSPNHPNNSTQSSLLDALSLLKQESKVTLNLKCQFFALVFVQFVSMACTVLVFPSEVRIFLNEHKNKWYSSGSYFWSKYMLEIPIAIVMSYVYSFIIYYGTGQLLQTFRFAYYTLIMTCGMIIANSVGYLIGIIFAHNFQVATTACVAFFLVLALLSGFFMPLSSLNIVLRGASYLSYIKLTFESVMMTIYGFNRCNNSQIAIILHQLDLNESQMSENSYWILGHTVVWRFIALFALIYRANDWDVLSIFRRKQTLESIPENKSITFTSNYVDS